MSVHKVRYLRYAHLKNAHFRKETPLLKISQALIAVSEPDTDPITIGFIDRFYLNEEKVFLFIPAVRLIRSPFQIRYPFVF